MALKGLQSLRKIVRRDRGNIRLINREHKGQRNGPEAYQGAPSERSARGRLELVQTVACAVTLEIRINPTGWPMTDALIDALRLLGALGDSLAVHRDS